MFLSKEMLYIISIAASTMFLSIVSDAQNSWKLEKDKNGIVVYSRKSDLSKFNQLRVVCTVEAKLSDLAALILDVNNYIKWVYSTKRINILKKVGESELYYYSEINSPWPVTNRDLPVHLKILEDTATRVMTILADCIPNYIPLKKNIVRVPVSKAIWKVTALDLGKINIDYQLEVDVGGYVPSWIFNMFISHGPYESFKNLKDEIKFSKYTNATLSFIKN
jgi:START domain